MFGLFCFALAVLASLFKSKSRLEAENAVLRHQLIVLRRKVQGEGPAGEQRPLVLSPAVSLVSINPECSHDHPARDARALASCGLSLLLALEIALAERAAADRGGPPRANPADEQGESTLGRTTYSRRTT